MSQVAGDERRIGTGDGMAGGPSAVYLVLVSRTEQGGLRIACDIPDPCNRNNPLICGFFFDLPQDLL